MSQSLILEIHVVPNASRSEVAGLYGESIKIKIRAPAVDGKANAELTRFLSEILEISKRAIQIESGDHSRKKRVRIEGLSLSDVHLRFGIQK